jgi:hypothetical protein
MHAARRAAECRARRQVDNDPGPSSRNHRFGHSLRAEARALQINVENVIPVAFRHLQKQDAREHAGIVDQNVDRPEPLLDGRHHRLRLHDTRNVGLDRQRALSVTTHLIGGALRSAFVIEPVNRDIGARQSKFDRHRAADPLLRPRDQDNLAGALHVRISALGVVSYT